MVGRFQVMAMLQAARATVLGHPLDEAKSYGLNRAIFYAAAKQGFKGKGGHKHPDGQRTVNIAPAKDGHQTVLPVQEDAIGNEHAYYVEIAGKKRYVIGDKPIELEEFHHQIEQRFGSAFPQAWKEALKIIEQADRDALVSQQRFYKEIYQPQRDELAHAWTTLSQQKSQAIRAIPDRRQAEPIIPSD